MQDRLSKNELKLGSVLQNIYDKQVKLEPNHLEKQKVLVNLLYKLKLFCSNESEEFRRLFIEFYYTGSYFEELRVGNANEFDINIVFSLPSIQAECRIDELEIPLSYATLQSPKLVEEFPKLKCFLEQDYVIGKNVRKWFQSLIGKFCHSLKKESVFSKIGIQRINETESGPACTLKVCYNLDWISIDLVPVFQIDAHQLKRCTFTNIHNLSEESLTKCYLVPKPLKQKMMSQISPRLANRAWRIHFPEAEKQIIAEKSTLKTLIKLMKTLRDTEEWTIPSYFIKVTAFWLVNKHPHPHYWNHSELGPLFIDFLKALEGHLSSKHLAHIIYPEFNLFQVLNEETLGNMENRIHNIIKKLRENPDRARNLFRAPTKYHRLC